MMTYLFLVQLTWTMLVGFGWWEWGRTDADSEGVWITTDNSPTFTGLDWNWTRLFSSSLSLLQQHRVLFPLSQNGMAGNTKLSSPAPLFTSLDWTGLGLELELDGLDSSPLPSLPSLCSNNITPRPFSFVPEWRELQSSLLPRPYPRCAAVGWIVTKRLTRTSILYLYFNSFLFPCLCKSENYKVGF